MGKISGSFIVTLPRPRTDRLPFQTLRRHFHPPHFPRDDCCQPPGPHHLRQCGVFLLYSHLHLPTTHERHSLRLRAPLQPADHSGLRPPPLLLLVDGVSRAPPRHGLDAPRGGGGRLRPHGGDALCAQGGDRLPPRPWVQPWPGSFWLQRLAS